MSTIHTHRIDWREIEVYVEHLLHDSRFWAGVAIVVLLGLMILAAMLVEPSGNTDFTPIMPVHPYGLPY